MPFDIIVDKQAELRSEEAKFWDNELVTIEKVPDSAPEKASKRPVENSDVSTCVKRFKRR
jgi:hypothetical protein